MEEELRSAIGQAHRSSKSLIFIINDLLVCFIIVDNAGRMMLILTNCRTSRELKPAKCFSAPTRSRS